MNMEKKIFICFLFAALLITAGCRKDDTPAEAITPVGFRIMAQTASSKSDTPNPLPSTIGKFGVWGIARNALNTQYLWNQTTFVDVLRQTDGTYVPAFEGYWFSNSTHDFLALASNPSTVDLPTVSISNTTNSSQLNPKMSFTYDLSDRYASKNYDFDLLGTAAHNVVEKTTPSAQNLTFWHLFSQINISVVFTGNHGDYDDHVLNNIEFKNIMTEGSYTISYDDDSYNDLAIDCDVYDKEDLTIDKFTTVKESDGRIKNSVTLNIIPQDISQFIMSLDFTRQIYKHDNDPDNPDDDYEIVPVTDFEIDLTAAKKAVEVVLDSDQTICPYALNCQYNWKITISSKNVVNFTVSVNDWLDGGIILEEEII